MFYSKEVHFAIKTFYMEKKKNEPLTLTFTSTNQSYKVITKKNYRLDDNQVLLITHIAMPIHEGCYRQHKEKKSALTLKRKRCVKEINKTGYIFHYQKKKKIKIIIKIAYNPFI